MVEENLKDEQGLEKDPTVRMLFGDGIMGMAEDGYEGSRAEHEIFMEVFYGNNAKGGNYGNSVSGAMTLQSDDNIHSDALVNLNCGNPILSSNCGGDSWLPNMSPREQNGSECLLESSSSWAGSDAQNANMKQLKISTLSQLNYKNEEHSNCFLDSNYGLVNLDMSTNDSGVLMHDPSHVPQQVPYHIVEDSGQIILSNYDIFNGQGEIGGICETDDAMSLDVKSQRQGMDYDKRIAETKSAMSPVSHESFCSEQLVAGTPAAPIDMHASAVSMKRSAQHHSMKKSDTIGVSSKALNRVLPDQLRAHAHDLLKDAGWKIDPRVRSDRAKLASYFTAPEKRLVLKSLSHAWKSCGQRLYASSLNSERDEKGREWADIDIFWNDLADTLAYIEKEMHKPEISISLWERWQLLDPFMAVVCINKKISVLRERKTLKAINSETFVLGGKKDMILTNKVLDRTYNYLGPSNPHGPRNPPEMIQELNCKAGEFEGSVGLQALQHCDDLHSRRRYRHVKQKLCCCGERQKISLKSMAGQTGKKLYNATCLHDMNYNASAYEHKRTNVSASEFPSELKVADSTNAESDMNAFSNHALDPAVSSIHSSPLQVCFSDTLYSIQESEQKIPLLPEKKVEFVHKKASYISCPLSDGSSCRVGHCTGRKNGTEDASVLLAMRRESSVLEEGLNHNLSHKHLAACPCSRDDGFVEDLLTNETTSTTPKVHTQSRMNFVVHKEKLSEGPFIFGLDGFDAKKNELAKSSAAKPVNSAIKKARKKSKRISEIEATGLNCVCGGNCVTLSDFKMNEQTDDHLGLACHQEKFEMTKLESISKSQKKPKCLEKYEAPNLSKDKILHTSSVGVEVCSTVKMPNKYLKSEIKAARQHGKEEMDICSQDKILEAEERDSMLNEVRDRKITTHRKSTIIKSMSVSKSQKRLTFSKDKSRESDFEESLVSDDSYITMDSDCKCNAVAGELVLDDDAPPEVQNTKKVGKPKKAKGWKENGRKRPRGLHINDDDLLITGIIKNKDFSSCSKFTSSIGSSECKSLRKLKSQKGVCKLILQQPGIGGKNSVDAKLLLLGRRTVLRWLIASGVVSTKDVVQYRNLKNDEVVKDGWVTKDGILCNCCTQILSVPDFKAHAGPKLQKSSFNLFLQSGKSYTLCQLEAWTAEYRARKTNTRVVETEGMDQNDDTCGLCGDGGELICCDNCPSTYHQACLSTQELPEGSWYCDNCICQSCGDAISVKEASSSLVILKCSQCEHKYHDTCITEEMCNGDVGSETWFCGRNCQEVYLGLRSRVGVANFLTDGYSWTILRCNHEEEKVLSAQKIALMAECNTKLAIALTIMEECFVRMVDTRTGIDMIPHVLYNWGSNFVRLNYQGFYTIILEKGDEIISVASIRVHGVRVAELPFIATCTEHRRQGMCRRLMYAIEEMLRAFHVKILVLSAIPDLVNTWTSGFGFKPIEDDEKQQLNHVNLMLFPGAQMLTKRLDENVAAESGGKTDLGVREYHCQNPKKSDENECTKSGPKAANVGRIDTDTESLLPTSMTSEEISVDGQSENLQLSSRGSDLVQSNCSERGVFRNAEESSIRRIETCSFNEFNRSCSIKQALSTQMGLKVETCQNVRVLSDTGAKDVIDNDEILHFDGGELNTKRFQDSSKVSEGGKINTGSYCNGPNLQNDKRLSDGIEGQHWAVKSDDMELEQLNSNNLHVCDSSSAVKDELCGSVGWHHVAEVCSTGKIED
ncbi:uncharacterized protein [Typha angustifolia]|uniref:uncharacterized protein n=1 Tax=Typha angustifolia TaxID=59011 RepID=UPI003C30611E